HQGEEDHPGDEVELGNHVGEAHLLERSGIVCAGRGGGFLKHDAYLWMSWKKKDCGKGLLAEQNWRDSRDRASVHVEVDRDTDAAGHRDTVLRGRVEAPLPRGLDRGTVEVTVAAGALDLHVEHVPLGVDAD